MKVNKLIENLIDYGHLSLPKKDRVKYLSLVQELKTEIKMKTLTDKQELALFEVTITAYDNFTSKYKQQLYDELGIDCAYDYFYRVVLSSINNLTMIDKNKFQAIKELTRLEAFACGSNSKEVYRLHFCIEANEWTVQLKDKNEWLCLHDGTPKQII